MKIYYDKITGERIWDMSYNQQTKVDFNHDYEVVRELNVRTKESIGLLVLENGAYEQDFADSNGFRVNVATKTLEFSYPDPNHPEAPQVFETPLTDQIKILKQEQSQLSSDFQGLTDYLAETGVL